MQKIYEGMKEYINLEGVKNGNCINFI